MSSNDINDQPVRTIEDERESASSEESDASPKEKSSVRVGRNVVPPEPRYYKRDLVHKNESVNGVLGKVVFTVHKSHWNSKGFYEYQIVRKGETVLHKEGAWIRERDLKMESRG